MAKHSARTRFQPLRDGRDHTDRRKIGAQPSERPFPQLGPRGLAERVLVHTDAAACERRGVRGVVTVVRARDIKEVRMLCLVAAPEGIERVGQAYGDVANYAAALDERLNKDGYILPGLGDAGDRLFGTR